MAECTLHYQVGYPEFYEGIRAVTPRTSRIAWVGAGFMLFMIVVAIGAAFLNPFNFQDANPWKYPGLFAVCALFGAPAMWQYATRFRRAWKRNAQFRFPHTLVVNEEGLAESWESTRVQTAWSNVRSWLQTENVVVITTNIGFFIVPKRQVTAEGLKGLEGLEGLIEFLRAKATRGTGGFPVEPRATASRCAP